MNLTSLIVLVDWVTRFLNRMFDKVLKYMGKTTTAPNIEGGEGGEDNGDNNE